MECSKKSSVHLIWDQLITRRTKIISVILYMLMSIPSKPRIIVCVTTMQLTYHLISLIGKNKTGKLFAKIMMFGSNKLSSCLKKTDNKLSKIYLDNLINKNLAKSRRVVAQLIVCTPFMSTRLINQQYYILVIDKAANLGLIQI